MKYREIQVMQQGGGVFFSAVADPAAQTAQQQQTTSGSSDDNKLISESVLNELFKKAMPNDVRKFTAMLANFEQQVSMGLPVNKRALYDLQAYANQIIKQSEYMDKAEKQASENGAWDEVAINNRGNIYALDEKGKLQTVAVSKYNPEKYQALSIGELIQMRKEDDQLVDRQDIITTIGNSIGTEKINDYIQNIIKTVGQNETTSEAYKDLAGIIGGMAKRPTMSELQTLQGLSSQIDKLGMDAIFKVSEGQSSKNIQDAFKYIIGMLPKNMRMQLQGKYVAELGGKYEDSGDYAQQLVMTALGAANDTKYTSKIDYEGAMNTAAGTSSGKAPGQQNRNLTNLEVLVQGTLNQVEYQLRSSKTPALSMNLRGSDVGVLTTVDNNIIPKAPMSSAIESSIGPLIDKNHIMAGTQKIPEGLLDTILYDGNDVINIWAPVNLNGDIDFDQLQQFNEIMDSINRDPSLTTADKNAILRQYGIQGQIDDQGNFTGSGNMAQFLVLTGVTSDEVLSEDNPYVEVLDKKSKNIELQQIERAYSRLNSKIKDKDAQYEFKKGWFDFSTDIMKVPIFMKLKSTAQTQVGTLANKGPMVTTPTYQDQIAYDQMRQIRQQGTVMTPSASLIFQKNE